MSESHDPSFYVKIWGVLLVLLVVSVVGPMAEIQWLTLITAFGIAVVKAYLVVINFMHINLTPRFISYMMVTSLVFMLLFYAGTAPDVMKDSGQNWKKPAWIQAEADYAAHGGGGGGHGEGHGGGHH
ncbi:MAG: cytochrome C oxidase subunit IV family protein [Deltaproteobacteria bacterium]|jgi:caa(3)-type oxidase subunit IV|nr:cytochrome C oxidase subunit IV family protein [Deltaproteobacteria bacterium]MBW2501000.1 cytochrome C oxidase subunit IV family protein [Deltaproteobacteria bacterium]